jgi:hypothetical protein
MEMQEEKSVQNASSASTSGSRVKAGLEQRYNFPRL